MRLFTLILFSIITAVQSYAQPDNYTLSDSLEFSNEITAGVARVLKLNNRTIDTIDAAFGIQDLDGTSMVYHKIEIDRKSRNGKSYEGSFSDYVIYKEGKKSLLKKILPDFDDWFSSPSIIQGCILYWGIKGSKNSKYLSIYAKRYDISRGRTDSILLFSGALETDNPGFFYRPVKDFGGFCFEFENRSWLVNESFSLKQLVK